MDEMDTLGILIQAILSLKNPEKSKQQILADLPELQKQLNSDKNARINIVAGLDIKKSAQLIQANLNTLVGKANALAIELGVNVGKHNIEKVINNELSGISQTSQTVSDEMVKNFNKAFGISQKLAKEARTEIKLTMQDITDSWNSGNIDKYTASMQKLMDLAGHHGITIIDPQTKEQINQIRSQLSDGGKVHIGEGLHEELKSSLDTAQNIQQILSNVYGVGKWTYDKRKSRVGTDNLVEGDEYVARMKEAIVDANEAISRLQRSKSTVIDSMSEVMSPVQIEEYIREILKLSNVTKELTFDPNFGGAVVNIASEFDEIQSKAQQTGDVINKSLSGKYASDNSGFIKEIKTLESEETAVNELTAAFKKYGIAVKSVNSTKTLDENGNLNNLTVSITSKTGEIENFKYAAQEANGQTVLMLQNVIATDKAVQKLIQSQQIYNDKLEATAISFKSQLEKVKNDSSIKGKPINFNDHAQLTKQYNTAIQAIEKLKTADNTTMASMKANVQAEINKLRQMVDAVKDAEYKATELRTKDIGTIKDIQTNNLEKITHQIKNSKVPIEVLQKDIGSLKTSLSAISKENPESLTNFLNQFDIVKSKFDSLKEFYKSIGKYTNQLDVMASNWKDQGIYTDELKNKIAALRNELKQISDSGNTTALAEWTEKNSHQINTMAEKQRQLNEYLSKQVTLTKEIFSLRIKIANTNPDKNPEKLAALQQQLSARQHELFILQQQNSSMTELMTMEQQEQYIIKNTARERERCFVAERNAADAERRRIELVKRQAIALKAQITSYEVINSKAAQAYKNEFNGLKNGLTSATTTEEINKIRSQFTSLKSEIKVAGKEGQTFWQKMKDGAQKFKVWFSVTSIIMRVVSDIRKMVSTVIELDTCLVDLQKTFKGTASELNSFYYEANNIAKQLGVTTAEIIKSASSWSRLGFNTKETAIQMAKAASTMKMISPEMSIDTANSGLTSIVKAFDEINIDNIVDEVLSPINPKLLNFK